MPRVYKRKTKKMYTLETLKIAIKEIQEKKLSFRKAAEKYNVPRATLLDQVKKSTENVRDPKRGKKPIFNESQEEELVQFILESCKNYYGITPLTLRKVAFDFATANGSAHNFNRATGLAGMDWYYSFMSRHPEISLRKPEATSLSRINAFNENEVDIFFTNLISLMTKYHFRPDAIYNVDETGINTVQRNSKILAPRGLKQVGKCTSAERGTLTTVVNAFNASGNYIPPFFIFKRKRMNPLLMKQSNSNMIASISDSGWINEELFVHWLHHFKSFTRPSADNPIMLVLDNHESHISLAAYNFCKKNYIHVITLPPHTSHKMQPLDLTFHGPLKTAYNRECEMHMVNNPGAKITSYDVVGLYTKAFNRTTNIEKAMNGFRVAGICPLDKEIFRNTFSNLLHSNTVPQSDSYIKTSNPDLNEFCTQNEHESQPTFVPLQDIINIPTIKSLCKKTNQKRKHSIIVTNTPEKIELEKKEQKKIEKRIKQKPAVEKGKAIPKYKKIVEHKKKSQKGVKNLGNFENNADDKDYFCIFCSEKYHSPPTEDWVMCLVCQNWAHDNCTSGSTSRGYICDFCIDK